jgi:hypothetical protein
MRQITFRAWDWDNKKMLNHSYFEHHRSGFRLLDDSHFEFMQFTGLRDKKGQEIYEGDIVDVGGEVCEVKYNPPSFAAYNSQKHEFNIQYFGVEVIGNIYENPELLNEKAQGKS